MPNPCSSACPRTRSPVRGGQGRQTDMWLRAAAANPNGARAASRSSNHWLSLHGDRGPERMGRSWDVLMKRLGYIRYVAPRRRLGCVRRRPDGLAGTRGIDSRSTRTCLPTSRPTSTWLCMPATRRQPVCQRRNDAPTSSWSERSSRSSTPDTWRRGRRPCTASRIHPVGLAARLLDDNDADGQPAAAVLSALDRTASATGELTRD
jgi:hypothetical protein